MKKININEKQGHKKLNLAVIIAICTVFAFCYSCVMLVVMVGTFSEVVYVIEEDNSTISKQYQYNKNAGTTEATDGTTQQTFDETEAGKAEDGTTGGSTVHSDVTLNHVQTVEGDDVSAVVTDVTEVVKTAMPCVVSITNEYSSYDSWYGDVVDDEACGSGIIIEQNDQELMIVTNYHVIEDSKSLIISFIDDSEAEAYVKGVSSEDDLAIVSVSLSDLSDETINAIAIAALGDSDTLQVGEPAIAIGNSLGYGQSVTTGVISALNRNINESYLIQTDAAINPGNSGGALLNIKGEVIGINSSKIADYVIEGMGYAIPISTAKPIIDELMLNETKKKVDEGNRGFLGISGTDVTEDASSRYGMPQGVYVASVIDGGGAKNAGIAKGDIITTFDGVAVDSMTSLQAMLEYYEAGANVDVVIMRQSNGEYVESTVTVTLGKKQS